MEYWVYVWEELGLNDVDMILVVLLVFSTDEDALFASCMHVDKAAYWLNWLENCEPNPWNNCWHRYRTWREAEGKRRTLISTPPTIHEISENQWRGRDAIHFARVMISIPMRLLKRRSLIMVWLRRGHYCLRRHEVGMGSQWYSYCGKSSRAESWMILSFHLSIAPLQREIDGRYWYHSIIGSVVIC